jgi:hypothetical protein
MNREELREKVADELTGCPIWENAANIGSDDAWEIADRVIRVTLSALADDLDRQADEFSGFYGHGLTDAAESVRSLIEEGKSND